ncbi:Ribosomal RNA small subunit methyltransferase E [Actinomyces bovis]|uniref:Ribosomal RNA small subunit methyltransferase E n=1 Tax=Actinomyces bovis TaxID=1658 RepID=A0ABY1VK60_9ACTO|nr:16S rRNA (uracil(1498)-N(3))-methyltransferase [Actinomyces bovis]SPT52501.1 Ribosomal RNA small subunit methyltransferase E [Actinomyces bovis]VEG54216.1 Ribosomal RNA small subunit methyltransferase E [Actinomyces israelii]
MTAPVFILTPQTLEPAGAGVSASRGARLTLTGAEARHAVTVRRLRAGERVDLVDGAGLRLICEVEEAGVQGRKDQLGVRVVERVEEAPTALRLTLVQALAKGDRDEQAVETATEVGVDLVLPWQAERCVSVWKGLKAAKGRERWRSTVQEAAKQARRAWVPTVEEPHNTKQLCSWVAEVVQAGGVVLVLHEEATAPISSAPLPVLPAAPPQPGGAASPVLAVVVGPEGGISAAETAALETAGAVTVRLGPHVMRTASAGPAALAVLAQRAGLWG